jgi:plastocyanin
VRWRTGLILGILVTAAVVLIGRRQSGVTHVVTIENLKYSPAVLTIHRGDRVQFRNQDIMPHTATAREASGFDSGLVKQGETWTVTPEREGVTHYVCSFHPVMEGTIIVERR